MARRDAPMHPFRTWEIFPQVLFSNDRSRSSRPGSALIPEIQYFTQEVVTAS
jgi:hypothetical protein